MNSPKPIQALVDEWLAESDVQTISKQTYARKIQYWFRWIAIDKRSVERPTKADVVAYKQALATEGKSELTVAGYVRVVKLFYKWTSARNIWPNIAIEIHCPLSQRGHRKSALTAEQAHSLLESIDLTTRTGLRNKLAIMMMLHLGLRTVELERMNVGDISTIDGFPVVYVQRKGRREKREALQLTQGVSELLTDYIGDRAFSDDEPLFVVARKSIDPKRLHRSDLTKIVKHYLRAIGIDNKKITTHSLRHTCASLLLANGVDIETIRNLLGHQSTDTTRIYLADAISEKLIKNSPALKVENIISSAAVDYRFGKEQAIPCDSFDYSLINEKLVK